MTKQSPKQNAVVARVMHEFKAGDLEKRDGTPVENPKQAIAIALHEAGASDRETPAKNRANLRRTVRRERDASSARGDTRAALYAEARRRDIPGRSKMTKAELRRALG